MKTYTLQDAVREFPTHGDAMQFCDKYGLNVPGNADVWEKAAALKRAQQDVDSHFRTDLARLREENRELRLILTEILNDLPIRRDWLNPDLEKAARAALARGEGRTS